MRYIVTALVVFLMVFIVLLVQSNQETIMVTFAPGTTKEMTTSAFFLFSFVLGAGAVFFLYFLRDTKRFLRRIKVQRDQKKHARVQELYTRGLNALLAKRNPEASSFFKKVLVIDPDHVDTLLRFGISRLREKNPQEAILLHQRALNLAPGNQEAMFSLAADYEEVKRYDDALKVYRDIVAKDATNLSALFRMRDLHQRLNQWEDLVAVQQRILEYPLPAQEQEVEFRRMVGYRYEHGRSLLEAGSLERAKKAFRAVLKLDRDFIPAYLGLGEVYLEENRPKDAEELWIKAYQTTSSLLLLFRLEDLCLRQGEPGKAIEQYRMAVERNPKDMVLKFFLAKLFYRLEMVDDAFNTLITVDWGDRDFPDVHKLLGSLYLRRGSLGLAATELKKALGFRTQFLVPYTCTNCQFKTVDWSGRCPNCGKWNTFGINLEKSC